MQKTRTPKLQPEIKATGLFPRSPEEDHVGVLFALPGLSMAHISSHHHVLTSMSPSVPPPRRKRLPTRFLWLVSECSDFLSHFPESCHLSCFISLSLHLRGLQAHPSLRHPLIPLNHLLPFILNFPCFYPPNITRMWALLIIPTPSGAAHHHLFPR